MIEIIDVSNELSKERPVFHSEADFQHALAWKICEKYHELNIRLEKRVILNDEEIYFDTEVSGEKFIINILKEKGRMKTGDVEKEMGKLGAKCPDESVRFLSMLRMKNKIKGKLSVEEKGWMWWI